MTDNDYARITHQLAVLRDVASTYGGKNIDNIIMQLESRRKWYEDRQKEMKT